MRNILWLTPTPPVFFRIYAMGIKKVKVKNNASDFEIYETHGVLPLSVEKKLGGFRKFTKEYEKWAQGPKGPEHIPLRYKANQLILW